MSDLAELMENPDPIEWESEALGTMYIFWLSISVYDAVFKKYSDLKAAEAEEFTRYLMSLIVSKKKEINSKHKLTAEQVSAFTSNDLESFSKVFIDNNTEIFLDLSASDSKVTEFYIGVSQNMEAELKKMQEVLKKFNLTSGFSDRTKGLLYKNSKLSSNLSSSYLKSSDFERQLRDIPMSPENPQYESNRFLSGIQADFQGLSALVQNMNELGIQMSLDSNAESKKTKKWNNIMFALGFLSLIATALLSWIALDSSNKSSKSIETLLEEGNILNKQQITELQFSKKTQQKGQATIGNNLMQIKEYIAELNTENNRPEKEEAYSIWASPSDGCFVFHAVGAREQHNKSIHSTNSAVSKLLYRCAPLYSNFATAPFASD